MRAPLWPTELSRRGTPPGTRTRNRSLRRRPRFPLCASGVRSLRESNPAQCRPGDSNPASFRGKSPVPVLSGASGKSWPPRSRTERYRLIRAAPSTGWVVASGRRKCRSSRRLSLHGLSRPVAAPAAHLPFTSARRAADSNRNACTPIRFRGGACVPGRITLHERTALPHGVNKREMAEDGELESQRR